MSAVKKYKRHELNYFPEMEGEDRKRFKEDIEEHGQIDEITIFENKILDGWNTYLVCLELNMKPKVKDLPKHLDAKTYSISKNLMRRHLNIAQRAELGLLLLKEKEEEIKEKERIRKNKMGKDYGRGKDIIAKSSQDNSQLKIKKLNEGRATDIVAPKVKVSAGTLMRAKKIKKVAEKEPMIAKEWEKAKKGNVGIREVYEKAKIIEKLPEDLKKEVRKEKSKITFKEAKEIAEFPKPEQRKIVMEQIKKTKQTIKQIIKEEKEIVEKKKPIPIMKKIDIDKKKIDKMQTIFFQITQEYTVRDFQDYNEITQKKCIEIMRKVYQFIFNEMEKYGKRPI